MILTNKPNLFQNSSIIETGVSNYHKLVGNRILTDFRQKLLTIKPTLHCPFNWFRFLEIIKLCNVITKNFQQIKNLFQLIEKFKHVQTFQLSENEKE